MLSVEIIKRSFFAITNNLGVVWRIIGFWVPLLVVASIPLLFTVELNDQATGTEIMVPILFTQNWVLIVIGMVAIFVSSIAGAGIMAIAWHRFLIADEKPAGIVIMPKGWRWGKYFWIGILIYLITMPIIILLSFFGVYEMVANNPNAFAKNIWVQFFMNLIVLIPTTFLGLALPAVAMQKPLKLGDSLKITRAHAAQLLLLTILVSGAYAIYNWFLAVVFGVPEFTNFEIVTVFKYVISTLAGWLVGLFGIGLLSELYKAIVPVGDEMQSA